MSGGGVEGEASGGDGGHGGAGVFGLEEGPILVAGDAAEEGVIGGGEEDDEAEILEEGPIFGEEDDAPAGGDHGVRDGGERGKGSGLSFTKKGFTVFGEDLGDGRLEGGGDEGIGIGEREVEGSGEGLADGRFSRAHGADEDEIFVGGGHG